jgi:hypothetical protein
MARIGDFREAFLSPDLITAHGAADGISFIREAYTALKLVCWINTLERRLFRCVCVCVYVCTHQLPWPLQCTPPSVLTASLILLPAYMHMAVVCCSAPYVAKDAAAKMEWFLSRFERTLSEPEAVWGDWQAEYTQVVSGFDQLAGADCWVEQLPGLGLALLCAPEPLHYYALFSHTIGSDVVVRFLAGCCYCMYMCTSMSIRHPWCMLTETAARLCRLPPYLSPFSPSPSHSLALLCIKAHDVRWQ